MYKIWKYFEKRQVIACNYCTQQTVRIGPAICWYISFWHFKRSASNLCHKDQQEIYVTLSRFWLLRVWQGWVNLLSVIKVICRWTLTSFFSIEFVSFWYTTCFLPKLIPDNWFLIPWIIRFLYIIYILR